MEEEIQHLLDQDIIEKVSDPTGWVSPPVVTPKKDQSQIRLNVDMRMANQAIPRRHTQHPTIDDVVNELSGSTVFSHLDMSKGYHQLELNLSSRKVTTFSTHIGLYSYKRLNYGTRSAAEIFQETIREELTHSFLCTVRYSSRFMEASRYQKAACKLGELVTGKFEWKQEHSEALEELKNMLSIRSKPIFYPQAEHELHIDGCPVGLAATLTQ